MSVTIRAVTSSERLTRLSCFLSATSWRALRLEYLGMARPPRRPEKAQWPPRRGGGGRRTASKRPGYRTRRTERENRNGAPRSVAHVLGDQLLAERASLEVYITVDSGSFYNRYSTDL